MRKIAYKTNRPVFYVVDSEKDDNLLMRILKKRTENRQRGPVLLYSNGIIYTPNKPISIEELKKQEDPSDEIFFMMSTYGIPKTIVPKVKRISRIEVTLFKDIDNIHLYSPKQVPSNAILIGLYNMEYIQFTKNSIVSTNGVLFSSEAIGEITTSLYEIIRDPCDSNRYIIRIKDSATDSIHGGIYYLDIKRNALWNSELGDDYNDVLSEINNELQKNGIHANGFTYATKDYSILYTNDHYIMKTWYPEKYSKDITLRIKVESPKGIFYVPYHLAKECMGVL